MEFLNQHPDGVAATVIITLVGAFSYCIKKTADSGVAFRSKCCSPSGAAVEVAVDTNPGTPREDFYDRGGPDTESGIV